MLKITSFQISHVCTHGIVTDSTHGIHSTLLDDTQTLIRSSTLQHLLQQLLLLLLLLWWLQGQYSKELASTLLPDCHDKWDFEVVREFWSGSMAELNNCRSCPVQTGNLLMRNSDGSTTDTLQTAGEALQVLAEGLKREPEKSEGCLRIEENICSVHAAYTQTGHTECRLMKRAWN